MPINSRRRTPFLSTLRAIVEELRGRGHTLRPLRDPDLSWTKILHRLRPASQGGPGGQGRRAACPPASLILSPQLRAPLPPLPKAAQDGPVSGGHHVAGPGGSVSMDPPARGGAHGPGPHRVHPP